MQPTAHRDVIFAEIHRREERIFNCHVISQQLKLHEPRQHACDSNRLSRYQPMQQQVAAKALLPPQSQFTPTQQQALDQQRPPGGRAF